MGDRMRLLALTGISRESLKELTTRHIRTFEFHSANNVLSFSGISPGDMIFLSEVPPSDLAQGICGCIVIVRGYDTRMQHVYYGSGNYNEEAETMSARAQLAYHAQGKIKSVEIKDIYKPVYVDVIEVKFCEAK